MSFKTIRTAQQAAWPFLQESLDIRRRQREQVEADPDGATTAAKTRAQMSWTRVVMEETVWAIAKAGLLREGAGEDAVIGAALDWYESWADEEPSGDDDQEDANLHLAVQEMLNAIEKRDQS